MKEKLRLLPDKPGCYLMKDKDGVIIYVGKAKNLKRRVNSYFNRVHTGKTYALVSNIVDFDYIVTNTNRESLILEINLIKKYNPKYNILLKDDKTYPFIALYKKPYPALKIERYKNKKQAKARLFGPYPNVVSARKTVEVINRIYPLKKCNKLGKDLCLYYHIGECLGYCKYNVRLEKQEEMIKEITDILNGDVSILTKRIEKEMYKASDALNYERAFELKKYIDDIKVTLNKQIIVSSVRHNFDVFGIFEKDNFISISVLFIRDGVITGKVSKIFSGFYDKEDIYLRYIIDFYEKFNLPKEMVINDLDSDNILSDYFNIPVLIPKKGDVKKILNMANLNAEIESNEKINLIKRNENEKKKAMESLCSILNIPSVDRIELFDNSHLFGTYYVGAMVCFSLFEPDKKKYRKYQIDAKVKDDLSAMKEVIYRRYYRVLMEGLERPDLIIVDGGPLQVEVCKEILDSLNLNIKVIGLKKDDRHRTHSIIDSDLREIPLPKENNLYLYLTRMQDEVHRFVITYHRDIKSKGSISSVLDGVKGIGDKRRKLLLKKFGSIKKIKEASVEELGEIIPLDVAVNLKRFLEEKEQN